MKFSGCLTTVAAYLLLPAAGAYFRLTCAGPLLLERYRALIILLSLPHSHYLTAFARLMEDRSDPIVYPGQVASHLHNIVGGNAFNFSMTYEEAAASTCSSCKAKADKSNYWVVSALQPLS